MTIKQSFKFVGRDDELKQIEEALFRYQETDVVTICGEGGIGKSSLLAKIINDYKSFEKLKFTNIIDISETSFQIDFTLTDRLSHHFEKKFEDYETKRDICKFKQTTGANDSETIEDLILAYEAFINDFNKQVIEKRCIILIDTFDKFVLLNENLIRFFKEVVPYLRNSVIIIAGRKANQVNEWIKPKSNCGLTQIQLKPFEEEGMELLSITDEAIKENVMVYSGGNPLLICMAQTYLDLPNYPIPEILYKIPTAQKDTLEFEPQTIEFEKALFRPFGDLQFHQD